jgi:hypothetical protein
MHNPRLWGHRLSHGAGRPPEFREPLVRKTVTLPASYVVQLEVLGQGNLSDGIRHLLETAHTPSGHLWLSPARTDP